jgi:predicted nucleic acid-binding protein
VPLLLDASVWLAALDRDDDFHLSARELVEAAAVGAKTLAALDLTLYEVANVAVVRWHSRRDAVRLVELIRLACTDTLERASPELLEQAAALAAEHELTVYDAAYVAAGRARDWTLVSADLTDLVASGLAVSPDRAADA